VRQKFKEFTGEANENNLQQYNKHKKVEAFLNKKYNELLEEVNWLKRDSLPKKMHEQKLQEKIDAIRQERDLEAAKLESRYQILQQEVLSCEQELERRAD